VTISIKWQTQEFKDVEVTPSAGLETLQAQIFTLTMVPPERQKIIIKGKLIKTDSDVAAQLKKGVRLMLTGTAEVMTEAPKQQVKFIEDMTEKEKTEIKESVGAGLNNLGNTCYMNSTLQCFRHIPELKKSLNGYIYTNRGPSQDMDHTITSNMGALFNDLDGSTEPVTPYAFTNAFRTAFPQFAQRDEKGHYMQQDADECLIQLMTSMSQKLKKVPEKAKETNAIDYIFGGQQNSVLQCVETDAEPVRKEVEKFEKLRCFIDSETNYVHEGIAKSLKEVVELRSAVLGRNAQFQRTRRVVRLPRYLIVQFVRFFLEK